MKIKGKGGKPQIVTMSTGTYLALRDRLKCGEFKLVGSTYRRSLERAAEAMGERYSGSHGLRHSFAQQRLGEIERGGATHEYAKFIVSRLMGHNRLDITETYLK